MALVAAWQTQSARAEDAFPSHVVKLVVPAAAIVHNMHEAYAWLAATSVGEAARFASPMFGTFLSGPSKTADIEQALVMCKHSQALDGVGCLGQCLG